MHKCINFTASYYTLGKLCISYPVRQVFKSRYIKKKAMEWNTLSQNYSSINIIVKEPLKVWKHFSHFLTILFQHSWRLQPSLSDFFLIHVALFDICSVQSFVLELQTFLPIIVEMSFERNTHLHSKKKKKVVIYLFYDLFIVYTNTTFKNA